jgi:LPS export ABC transporter protein LptC
MSLSNKSRIAIIIAVAVILSAIGVIAHRRHVPVAVQAPANAVDVKPSEATVTPTAPTITIKNITLKETDPARGYELTVSAKESMFLNNIEHITCNGVRCNITKNGEERARLIAKTARIERARKEVFFDGPARGILKDLTFFTSDVLYNFATQTVTTTRTTVLKHPSFTVTAPHSHIDLHNHVVTMSGGVHAEFSNSSATNHRR